VGLGLAAAGVGTFAVYKMVRPYFRYRETCHFCGQDCAVTYDQLNDFICPHCDQYNGWDGEGNYRRHLPPGSSSSFVANQQNSSGKPPENGLCRNCNLNQELKIAQLSNSQSDGRELEEYAAHLERAYRLCAACEVFVANKLRGQDAKMAPSVLEFRLERSRLDLSARSGRTSSFTTLGADSLVWVQVILAVVGLLVIVDQLRLLDKMARWHPAFEGLYFLSDLLCTLLPSSKMVLPVMFLSLILLHMIYRHVISKNMMVTKLQSQGQGGDSFKTRLSGASLCQPGSPEPESTISQGLEDLSNLDEPSPPPPSLFHPLSSTPTMSNPLKTRDEVTINHEFALVDGDNNSGCDISVLSLGSPPSSPRGEAFPSAPRQYSPPPSSTLSLFSPKRPLLRPSRLTSSWVAGGYWTSPAQQQPQPGTISRSSSQSSGFVSATPSLNNFNNSAAPSLNNFFPAPSQQGSVLNFPQTSLANFHRAESDRFSLASEPLSARSPISRTHHLTQRHHQQLDRLSLSSDENPSQAGKHKPMHKKAAAASQPQQKSEGWTFTVTLTPAHLLLGLSVAVNVALGVLWASQQ